MGKPKAKAAAAVTAESLDAMPNEGVLGDRYRLDAFQRLCYNGGLIDDSGRKGIKYGDIAILYDRAIRNMPRRLEERAHKRKSTVKKGVAERAADNEIRGRTEFEILMEELFEAKGVTQMFPTPMLMIVNFAMKVREARANP